MTVVTVRPDSTPTGAANFTIFGGAASINAALSDNNVATYVKKGVTGNGSVIVGFGTTSISSSVRVQQVRVRAQVLCPTSASRLVITPIVRIGGVNYVGAALTFTGSYAFAEYSGGYSSTAPDGAAWDQTRIDGLRAQLADNASGADLSTIYELFFDIDTTTQPTVTVASPTGTVTATTQPETSWTYADTDGTTQDYYQIRVFSAAQYTVGGFDPSLDTPVWDSGEVGSADNTATITEHLTDGTTYRAYVRVGKLVSGEVFYSNYQYSQFTVNVTPPTTPTLTGTYSSVSNAVNVAITGGSISGIADSQVIQVQRSDDAGSTWANVTGGSEVVLDGTLGATLTDYAAPRDVIVRYRARSIGTSGDNLIASAFSSPISVTVTNDDTWWLKAVSDPTINKGGLRVGIGFDVAVSEQIGVFRPLGRRTAVTVSAGVLGDDGGLTIMTVGSAEFDDAWALITHQGSLLLQSPEATQKYVRITERSYKRDGRLSNPLTTIQVKYVEVAA